MTYRESQELAALKQEVTDLHADVEELAREVKNIVATLNQMSGGRKVMMGVFGILGVLVTAIATYFGIHNK